MDSMRLPIEMDDPETEMWKNYYRSRAQSGSGLEGFRGLQFQNGYGWWDSIANRFIRWASNRTVKNLGRKAAKVLINSGADALEGENFVESLKKHGRSAVGDIAQQVADKLSDKYQEGEGIHRKRKSRKSVISRPKKRSRRTLKIESSRRKRRFDSLFI